MKHLITFLASLTLWATLVQAENQLPSQAVTICATEHGISRSALNQKETYFENNGCTLRCVSGFDSGTLLSRNPVYEGQACADKPGVCHLGVCVAQKLDPFNVTEKSEALRACGNIHHLDGHQGNLQGVYLNDHCQLNCWNGIHQLSKNSLNEGFRCPKNPKGICRNGFCVTETDEQRASQICAEKHKIDYRKANLTGTGFTNQECTLKCMFNGVVLSENHLHEGEKCPGNLEGKCQKGACTVESYNRKRYEIEQVLLKLKWLKIDSSIDHTNQTSSSTGDGYRVKAQFVPSANKSSPLPVCAQKQTHDDYFNFPCKAWIGPFPEDIKLQFQFTYAKDDFKSDEAPRVYSLYDYFFWPHLSQEIVRSQTGVSFDEKLRIVVRVSYVVTIGVHFEIDFRHK